MVELLFNIFCIAGTINTTAPTPIQTIEHQSYKEIHTDELQSWYEENKEMVLLDARGDSFNGVLLPKGIWLPYNAPEEAIEETLGSSKDILIVVYCANPTCPVSDTVINRLLEHGYTNIYKYREGIKEWVALGLPTSQADA